jgi:tetratricopeptide (TPR) repeat protein
VCRGDLEAALRLATHAVELGGRVAAPFFHVQGQTTLAQALVEAGEWSATVAAAEEGLALARRRNRIVFLELHLVAALARAHLGAGDLDRARAAAAEALALSAECPDPRTSRIVASAAAAHVLLRTDGPSPEALRALAEAEALAAAIPDRFHEARLRLERAHLARFDGDEASRRRLLDEAARLFAAMGADAWAERVGREAGRDRRAAES